MTSTVAGVADQDVAGHAAVEVVADGRRLQAEQLAGGLGRSLVGRAHEQAEDEADRVGPGQPPLQQLAQLCLAGGGRPPQGPVMGLALGLDRRVAAPGRRLDLDCAGALGAVAGRVGADGLVLGVPVDDHGVAAVAGVGVGIEVELVVPRTQAGAHGAGDAPPSWSTTATPLATRASMAVSRLVWHLASSTTRVTAPFTSSSPPATAAADSCLNSSGWPLALSSSAASAMGQPAPVDPAAHRARQFDQGQAAGDMPAGAADGGGQIGQRPPGLAQLCLPWG